MNEFRKSYFSYFYDQRAPHAVKFMLEKRTLTLFHRAPDVAPLTYRGEQTSWHLRGRYELRFEGASLNSTMYSLRYDASRDANVYDEQRFFDDSDRAFHNYLRDLEMTQTPRPDAFERGDRYLRLVEAALDHEAKQAAIKEDESEITKAQDVLLDALRSGKRSWRADHEGATIISLSGDTLTKKRIGEDNYEEHYSGRDAILKFLRTHFLWEATKDTAPHKPPETEIWKHILRQFE